MNAPDPRSPQLRDVVIADLARLVELNDSAVPAVPPTSVDEMQALLARSDYAFAAVEPATSAILGFVLGMAPGADYASENYRWFEERGTDHLYVDRIVVDERVRGSRIGQVLYDAVFRRARAQGRAEVTAEVNVEPPNPGSLRFHGRLGFVEVGRQGTKGDSVRVALLAASARSRLVTWQDPMVGASRIAEMTGLEYLEAMLAGTVPPPPISGLMRMTPTEVRVGSATFTCEPDESHYNPIGTVHGGLVCTLLDSVIGCAVQTTLPKGQGYTSIDIQVNYLRPVRADTGTLTAIGTVTKPGSRVAFAEGRVTDAAGKLIATATSSCLVFPLV